MWLPWVGYSFNPGRTSGCPSHEPLRYQCIICKIKKKMLYQMFFIWIWKKINCSRYLIVLKKQANSLFTDLLQFDFKILFHGGNLFFYVIENYGIL